MSDEWPKAESYRSLFLKQTLTHNETFNTQFRAMTRRTRCRRDRTERPLHPSLCSYELHRARISKMIPLFFFPFRAKVAIVDICHRWFYSQSRIASRQTARMFCYENKTISNHRPRKRYVIRGWSYQAQFHFTDSFECKVKKERFKCIIYLVITFKTEITCT